jgi:hypothetical protein
MLCLIAGLTTTESASDPEVAFDVICETIGAEFRRWFAAELQDLGLNRGGQRKITRPVA